jgi:RNA polymerase subunit RPABC4/transcription elongation factor Spt4
MGWCPKCRVKIEDDVDTCPECGAELLAKEDIHRIPTGGEAERMDPNGRDVIESIEEDDSDLIKDATWVTVAESTGQIIGQFIKSELEAAKIPVSVTGASFDSVKMYASFDGKIRVPKRYSEKARQIVDDILSSTEVIEELYCDSCGARVSPDFKFCPHCGQPFMGQDEQEEFTCQSCGAPVSEEDESCPKCGEPIDWGEPDDDDVEYMCQACGAKVSADDEKCPHCGESFEEEE